MTEVFDSEAAVTAEDVVVPLSTWIPLLIVFGGSCACGFSSSSSETWIPLSRRLRVRMISS